VGRVDMDVDRVRRIAGAGAAAGEDDERGQEGRAGSDEWVRTPLLTR
jgi:hypothetical protein